VRHALLIPASIGWLVLLIYSVRRFGHKPVDQRDRLVLVYGVRWFGLGMWIFAATTPLIFGLTNPLRAAVIFSFWLLPICLWAGWLWGVGTASVFEAMRRPR